MRGLGRFSRPEGEPIDWSMELLLWQSGAVVALNGLVTSVVDEFVIIILILQPLFRHRRQLILAQLAEWINWALNHNDLSFGSVSPPIKRQLQQSVSAFNALSIRPASPNCLFQCVCVCVCVQTSSLALLKAPNTQKHNRLILFLVQEAIEDRSNIDRTSIPMLSFRWCKFMQRKSAITFRKAHPQNDSFVCRAGPDTIA